MERKARPPAEAGFVCRFLPVGFLCEIGRVSLVQTVFGAGRFRKRSALFPELRPENGKFGRSVNSASQKHCSVLLPTGKL